jgi:hypothetical protein
MPATNSTYPKVAAQWLNLAFCFYQSLCLVDGKVLRNRHLRVAAERTLATSVKRQATDRYDIDKIKKRKDLAF